MKKVKRSSFKLNPIAASIVLAMATQFTANVAYGNAGFGTNTDISGKTIPVATYYANSPQGWQPGLGTDNLPIINSGQFKNTGAAFTNLSGVLVASGAVIPATGLPITAAEAFAANGNSTSGTVVPMINTGHALRKFVDPLTGAYFGIDGLPTAGISMGIPIGITDKWVDANGAAVNGNTDDFYEIACVEYVEQMHSDLAKPTRLRGYVQIETPNILNNSVKDITGVVGSEHIPGTYPDGTPIYKWKKDPVTGKWAQSTEQVYFVHAPHYLGPTLLASHSKPIRILFHNYLPYRDINGNSVGSDRNLGGDLTIPVDESLAGGGPVVDGNGNPVLDTNKNSPNYGKPVKFPQNRISVHWHGGDTPWTNDGTPHEWFAPAGDAAYTYQDATHPNGLGVGDAFNNVPDMVNPGPGSQTLYFPNNLSGRLMMYHDHASGTTRTNAYYGEAAGYLVYDNTELTLAANALGTTLSAAAVPTIGPLAGSAIKLPTGLLDSVGIPLVIQDKQFVPKNMGTAANANAGALTTNGQFQSQDAKWDLAHWGQEGDLFFPHVYETNQDPNSIDGTNPVGRWDWGPWFWPVFPSQFSLPSGEYGAVTTTPEAFVDTPVVNGQAYPTMTVDPKTYRFRILAIGNDRTWNFGLYEAVDASGNICDTNVNGITLGGALVANAAAPGETSAPANCTEVRMVPANASTLSALATATPLTAGGESVASIINLADPKGWPTDGRAGGVPDPTTAGPDIVQIGNEGGLLPGVAVWPAHPVSYDQNVRSMTVFNVLGHQLFMGGAERADVLIDFSKYAGKTILLYNDAPAPSPGFDPRIDYFTGDGDQTIGGGAYNTLPGYGPNTRTVMQFKVNATNTSGVGGALNVAALQAALPPAYAATQPKPNVPETAYNIAFPGTATTDTFARIFTGSNSQPNFAWNDPSYFGVGVWDATLNQVTPGSGVKVTAGGSGYTNPVVTWNGTLVSGRGGVAGTPPTTTVTLGTGGTITGITVTNLGTGFTAAPTVTITDQPKAGVTAGTGALATVTTTSNHSIHVINKAIQELFDPVYGRMNATLAVELPFSSATVATTIPLAYIDAPIDDPTNVNANMDGIADGEMQIWKITHNGVDSHPVHIHLINAQVINRVDWAGVVKPTEANELGWKETIRMNPLEDVWLAVKASRPVVPFGLPRSQRVLDPSQAIGSQLGFTQIDQLTGNAPICQAMLPGGIPNPFYVNGSISCPTDTLPSGLPAGTITGTTVTAYSNQLTDFDNEYVWHCHILGHEEFDFMRPFIFHPTVNVPDAPGAVTVNGSTVTWTDPTPFGGQDSNGVPTAGLDANGNMVSSPKNEVGFKVQETTYITVQTQAPKNVHVAGTACPSSRQVQSYQTTTVVTPNTTVLGTVPANTITWTDTSVPSKLVPALPNTLQGTPVFNPNTCVTVTTSKAITPEVVAFNSAGNSVPGAVVVVNNFNTGASFGSATNSGAVAGATAANNAATAAAAAATTAANNAAAAATAAATTAATTAAANTAANAAVAALKAGTPVAFAVSTDTIGVLGAISLTWFNNPSNVVAATGFTNVTNYTLSWSGKTSGSATVAAVATGATVTGLISGGSYNFNLVANATAGNSAAATITGATAP